MKSVQTRQSTFVCSLLPLLAFPQTGNTSANLMRSSRRSILLSAQLECPCSKVEKLFSDFLTFRLVFVSCWEFSFKNCNRVLKYFLFLFSLSNSGQIRSNCAIIKLDFLIRNYLICMYSYCLGVFLVSSKAFPTDIFESIFVD